MKCEKEKMNREIKREKSIFNLILFMVFFQVEEKIKSRKIKRNIKFYLIFDLGSILSFIFYFTLILFLI